MCRYGLLHVDDDAPHARGQLAHARSRREIVRGLVATVQHDDQRPGPSGAPPGTIDLVLARADAVGVARGLDAAPFQPCEESGEHYLSVCSRAGKILGDAATISPRSR